MDLGKGSVKKQTHFEEGPLQISSEAISATQETFFHGVSASTWQIKDTEKKSEQNELNPKLQNKKLIIYHR